MSPSRIPGFLSAENPGQEFFYPFPFLLFFFLLLNVFHEGTTRTDAKNNVTRAHHGQRNPNGKLKGGCSRSPGYFVIRQGVAVTFEILLHAKRQRMSSYRCGDEGNRNVRGGRGCGRGTRKKERKKETAVNRADDAERRKNEGLIRIPIAIKKDLHLISVVKKRRVRSLRARVRELHSRSTPPCSILWKYLVCRSSSRTYTISASRNRNTRGCL